MEVLSKYLALFEDFCNGKNKDDNEGDDDGHFKGDGSAITLYKEAIEHCARLYRAMVSGCNHFCEICSKPLCLLM